MKPLVQGLEPGRHRDLGLRRQRDCRYFAGHLSIPLWSAEVVAACRSLPIGILRQRGGLLPVAITGLRHRENLFVRADGRWQADYLPAQVRNHPFRYAQRTGDPDTAVLALVEDDPALIRASGVSGGTWEALFNEHDEPGPPVERARQRFQALMRTEYAARILAVCEALDLLVPWEIASEDPDSGRTIHLDGVLRVDETRLNALSNQDFARLRRHGGLLLIYAHLISVPVLAALKQRLRSTRRTDGAAGIAESLDRIPAGETEPLFHFD